MTSVPVGLVHDYLLVMRGAERSFAAIASLWPQAPIYTTLYSAAGTGGAFAGRRIRTSYLDRLGIGQRRFRALLPLYPRAVERLPVSEHRLLVSSSSAFAHGIRPGPDSTHVCYCYTPFRYAWHDRDRALREVPAPLRPALGRVLDRVRRWDLEASRRVTHYVAISELVRGRIEDCYGLPATVVHPPVEVERFSPAEPEDFLLVVSELVPHKRVGLALEAARLASRPIRVVGEGPELGRLRRDHPEARFLGRVSDADLARIYPRTLALVVPTVEEFGIAAVEAQAAGRPVVAAAAGGVLETVIDGETGVLVPDATAEALAEGISGGDLAGFDPAKAVANAGRFSTDAFRRRFLTELESLGVKEV
jgi:glycosyltransferase involved in cell wall biosynthesis